MSVENLKEYAIRCAADPELRARAKAIGVEDTEQHMRHAASLGLAWTMNDMVAFGKEVVDAEDDLQDLTEEELEQIAGGICTTTAIVVGAVAAGAVAGGIVAGAAGTAVGGGVSSAAGGGW